MNTKELKKLNKIVDGVIYCNIAILPANPYKLNCIVDGVILYGLSDIGGNIKRISKIENINTKRVSKVNWSNVKKINIVNN